MTVLSIRGPVARSQRHRRDLKRLEWRVAANVGSLDAHPGSSGHRQQSEPVDLARRVEAEAREAEHDRRIHGTGPPPGTPQAAHPGQHQHDSSKPQRLLERFVDVPEEGIGVGPTKSRSGVWEPAGRDAPVVW